MMALTFKHLAEVNFARCIEPHGFNHALDAWDFDDWMTAVGGEVGEALNVVKKLNRVRDGLSSFTLESETFLRAQLADELADAVIYADLLKRTHGCVSLLSDYDIADFAQLRAITLAEQDDLVSMSTLATNCLATAGGIVLYEKDTDDLVLAIDRLAHRGGIALGPAVISKFNRTSEKLGAPHRLEVE